MTLKYKLVFTSLIALTFSTPPLLAAPTLPIKFEQEHQVIDNFAASDAWIIDPLISKWTQENKEDEIAALADLLFSTENGIGLSAWRFNIGAGSYEQGSGSQISLDNLGKPYRRAELLQSGSGQAIDSTKQLGQLHFLKEAHQRGVQDFIAFVNSPPVWATKNGLSHPNTGTGVGSTNLDPDKVDDYAQFLVDVVKYVQNDIGVPVNYISPANEPSWEWQGKSQEGNRYNMDDLITLYTQLDDALNSAELANEVEIDAGEVAEYTAALSDAYYRQFSNSNGAYQGGMNNRGLGLYRNYIDELLGNESIRTIIGNKISLHGYYSDAWSDRMGSLRSLVFDNVQEVSPNAKIWMSEFSILGGSGDVRSFEGNGWDVNDIDYAIHVAKVIHRDLTRLNANAWHWWLSVTPYNYKDGLIKVNASLDASSIQTSKVLWTLGQFSRFIRPGYIRIDLPAVDDLDKVMASAYKSPDEDKLVIVAINSSLTAQSLSFEVSNLPQGKSINNLEAYITNNNNDLTKITPTSISESYELPAKSIVTFIADIGDVETPPIVSFSQDKMKVAEGGSVTFTSTTSNSPDSMLWTFTGGSPETSSEANPTVVYENAGVYDVSLTATNAFGTDVLTVEGAITVIEEKPEECNSLGYLNLETWQNISETGDYEHDSSVSSIPLDTAPTTTDTIDIFEIQADTGDNYATRIRGFVCAPLSGDYHFWIASDNQGELWLSSDESPENKMRIAYSSDWTDYQQWDKYESQQSAATYLIAGQKYYIETLHKEHNGGDNLSVGWQLPDGSLERPITSLHLSPLNEVDTDPEPDPTPTPESKSSGGSTSLYGLLLLLVAARRLNLLKA